MVIERDGSPIIIHLDKHTGFMMLELIDIDFQVKQEWECYVQNIDLDKGVFTALLLDLTANDAFPGEVAEFRIETIPNDATIEVCSVFSWQIGRNIESRAHKNGAVSVVSSMSSRFIFNKTETFTNEMLEKANQKAKNFQKIIWE